MHYIHLFGIIQHISEDKKTTLVVREMLYKLLCRPFGFGLESQFKNPCTIAQCVLFVIVHADICAHDQLTIA